MMKKLILLPIVCLLTFVPEAYAQPGGGKGAPPPPPFVKACDQHKEGDFCSFQDRDGTKIIGICKKKTNPRGNQELLCFNESFFKNMESRKDSRGPRQEPSDAAPPTGRATP